MNQKYNRVLVTGDGGFIAKNLIGELKKRNIKVIGLSSEYLNDKEWWDSLEFYLKEGEFGFIFHVGACSNTLEMNTNYMMIRNYESTRIISNWARDEMIPMVYSSSAASYGEDGFLPSNLYGWSKKIAEDLCVENRQIALRYFNVYGPGEEKKGKMSSVAYQMFQKNKSGERISLFPGKPTRDFIYIEDVVLANIYAMENYEDTEKKWYDVGTGKSRSFEDVMENLSISYDYLPSENIPKGYQFFTQADPKKFLPGWSPTYTLEKGLKKYFDYLVTI